MPTPYIDSNGVVWFSYSGGRPEAVVSGTVIYEGSTCSGTMWLKWPDISGWTLALAADPTTFAVHFFDTPFSPVPDLGYRVATTNTLLPPPAGTLSRWSGSLAECITPVDFSAYSTGFLRASDTKVVQRPAFTAQEPVHWEMR